MTCVHAQLSDGTEAVGALKELSQQSREDPGRCAEQQHRLAAEACIMLLMQDAGSHPCGAGCPHLPRLLGVSSSAAAPAPDPPFPGKAPLPEPDLPTQLLMHIADGGSLPDLLHKRHAGVCASGDTQKKPEGGAVHLAHEALLTELEVWRAAEGVVDAVMHMHRGGYAHGNINPDNVVFTDDGEAQLVGLGSARPLGTAVVSAVGTPGFVAPEMLKALWEGRSATVSAKTEVFALGSLLAVMVLRGGAAREHGLPAEELETLTHRTGIAAAYADRDFTCSHKMKQVIRFATKVRARERPSLCHMARLISRGRQEAERRHAHASEDQTQALPHAKPPRSHPQDAAAPLHPEPLQCAEPALCDLPSLLVPRLPTTSPPALDDSCRGGNVSVPALMCAAAGAAAPHPSPRTPTVPYCGTPRSALQHTPYSRMHNTPTTPHTAYSPMRATSASPRRGKGTAPHSAVTQWPQGTLQWPVAPSTYLGVQLPGAPPPQGQGQPQRIALPEGGHLAHEPHPMAPMMHIMQPAMYVPPGLRAQHVPANVKVPWSVPAAWQSA